MKIVDKAIKKVYRFNCPNCQSRQNKKRRRRNFRFGDWDTVCIKPGGNFESTIQNQLNGSFGWIGTIE